MPSFMPRPVLFLALFLCSLGASDSTSTSTFTTQICTTDLGSTKVSPIPSTTSTFTINSNMNITTTITPSTTVTPAKITKTSTKSTTKTKTSVLPPVTDSFTKTVTSTKTTKVTSASTKTDTTTITVTTTVPIAVTTVPSAANFLPILSEDSIKSAGGGMRKRSEVADTYLKEREAKLNLVGRTPQLAGVVRPRAAAASSYPTRVSCLKTITYMTVTTITSTAAGKTYTAPTRSTTITTTTISTSTVYSTPAHVSKTITKNTVVTDTSINTVFTTTVVTDTSTSTTYAGVSTAYAVCEDPSNYVSKVNGSNLDFNFGGQSYSQFTSYSPKLCCSSCASLGNCSFSSYFHLYNVCFLVFLESGGTCDPRYTAGNAFAANPQNDPNDITTISNSDCGVCYYIRFPGT